MGLHFYVGFDSEEYSPEAVMWSWSEARGNYGVSYFSNKKKLYGNLAKFFGKGNFLGKSKEIHERISLVKVFSTIIYNCRKMIN